MKRKILKSGLVALLLAAKAVTGIAQQTVQFTQYIFNPLILNPAYAGYRGETYANFMYRDQWAGLDGAPQTATASIEFLLPKTSDRVALSAQVVSDKLGPQQTLQGYLGYNYRIPLNEEDTKRLCFGISAGVDQYTIDGTAFRYVDNNDTKVPTGSINKVTPDANFGVYYYTPKFYVSAGLNNIFNGFWDDTKYNWGGYNFHSMEQHFSLYTGAGYVFNLSSEFKLKPSVLWKEDFRGPSNFDFDAFLMIHDIVWIGGSYRTGFDAFKSDLQNNLNVQDACSAIVEVYLTPHLRIGYSYDFTLNKLNPYQNGTHEISLGIGFPHKDKREISPRYF